MTGLDEKGHSSGSEQMLWIPRAGLGPSLPPKPCDLGRIDSLTEHQLLLCQNLELGYHIPHGIIVKIS